MGNAARLNAQAREKALQAQVLRTAGMWIHPYSTEEAQLYADIASRPRRIVTPGTTAKRLLSMGMEPNECHKNCYYQAQNDPSGMQRQVFGWWVQGDIFVCHSVIEDNEQLRCITPTLNGAMGPFEFVEDPKITWTKNVSDEFELRRDGKELQVGLRRSAEPFQRGYEELKRLLGEGIPTLEAVRQAQEFAERLLSSPEAGKQLGER